MSVMPSDPTCYSVRKEIKDLIENHEVPIASCGNGYFRIANRHELNEYIYSLKSRKRGIQERIDSVQRAFSKATAPATAV